MIKLLLLFILSLSFARAQSNNEEVAKKLQNPVSDMISVPLQFNFDQGFGKDDDGERVLMNLQPVYPEKISPKWNLIHRGIFPFISQTNTPDGTQNGMGDVIYEGFFSPNNNSPFIWGIGPVFKLPFGTAKELTQDKWSAGPTAVALFHKGPWFVGALAYHAWSFAGRSERPEVNESYFQPFINHTNAKAFTIGISAEHTTNHETDDSIGYGIITVQQVMKIKDQPMSFGLGFKHSYTGPEELKFDWGIRGVVTFVFPQ